MNSSNRADLAALRRAHRRHASHGIHAEAQAGAGIAVSPAPTIRACMPGRSTPGGVLDLGLGIRRGARRDGHGRCRPREDARRQMVSRSEAELRREPAAPSRRWGRPGVLGRGQGQGPCQPWPSSIAPWRRPAAALRAMGVVGRPCRRLPAQPAGPVVAMLAASIGAIFHLGFAGLRRAGRTRPLRPDRAEGPVRRRRLLVQRQDHRLPGQGGRDRGAPAVAAEAWWSCPMREMRHARSLIGPAARRDAGGFPRALSRAESIRFEQLPFDHPLYIMYSSGTTGVPKCIVHCAGGACCSTSRNTSCIPT
jgi:hypothetical protein